MKRFILVLVLCMWGIGANAALVQYDIFWEGGTSHTMTGYFRFDESLVGTGWIDESDVSILSIEGFDHQSNSIGTFVGIPFLFGFNTDTEEFATGHALGQPLDQDWNRGCGGPRCVGLGFTAGDNHQLILDDALVSQSVIPWENATFIATRSAVPIPAAFWLFGSALGLLGWMRRRVS